MIVYEGTGHFQVHIVDVPRTKKYIMGTPTLARYRVRALLRVEKCGYCADGQAFDTLMREDTPLLPICPECSHPVMRFQREPSIL